MSTTQPIRDLNDVRRLTNFYLDQKQYRNHLLIVFGLHSALRIGDMLKIQWHQVYNFATNTPKQSLTIKEQKTGKSKTLALHPSVGSALRLCAQHTHPTPQQTLFHNPHTNKPITRVHARRIIHTAGEYLGIPNGVSCHSLRKTFGYHAWRRGISPAVLMEIFNHSSLSHTRRYLGVSQDDLDMVYIGVGF